MTNTFGISELAEEFKVTARAIRFYEEKGLISPSRNGQDRIYSRRDRGRLKLILRGKRRGFSLSDIREMIELYDHGDDQAEQLRVTFNKCRERMAALEQQRNDIDEVFDELAAAANEIAKVLEEKGVKADDI